MVDVDTFLTTLYVMVDDFCKLSLPCEEHPGPQARLSRSEVMTLAIFGQWQPFGSERGFARYARRHLRAAFPHLPTREQLNRQIRQQHDALGSRPAMPGVVGRAGCRAWPILAGATAWAGMKGSIC